MDFSMVGIRANHSAADFMKHSIFIIVERWLKKVSFVQTFLEHLLCAGLCLNISFNLCNALLREGSTISIIL